MSNITNRLSKIQDLVIDYSLIDRNHYLARTDRRENDSEHSLAVALMCWYILDKYKFKLDVSKVLKYAITHDLVEVYAGDTNAFASKEARERKVELERQSLERLTTEFNDFPGMIQAMQGYELKDDDESLFVWTVDKIQALVMGDIDDWRPYSELEISYESFCAKYEDLAKQASPHIKEIFESIIDYYKTTYYDKKGKHNIKNPNNH